MEMSPPLAEASTSAPTCTVTSATHCQRGHAVSAAFNGQHAAPSGVIVTATGLLKPTAPPRLLMATAMTAASGSSISLALSDGCLW